MQELLTGTTLQNGKYLIDKVLGQGGFGITYKAIMKDMVTGSLGKMTVNIPVVVKEFFMDSFCQRVDGLQVSVPSTGSREQTDRYRQKFIKEARNIASLSHPNIVQVVDVFEENGTVYYVMQYLEGGSLRQMMNQGVLPEEQAVEYIRQIGNALQYMHKEKHLCHLDVKPSNIMLTADGQAKLIDFVISKGYDKFGNETSSTPVGLSPGYAPLEQYRNSLQDFSPVTDIYSLGASLLALLTGKTPPEAAVVNEDGLGERPSHISSHIWKAIEMAMQPRRKDRPQTINEFLDIINHGIENVSENPLSVKSNDEKTQMVYEDRPLKEEETKVIKNVEQRNKEANLQRMPKPFGKNNQKKVIFTVVSVVLLIILFFCVKGYMDNTGSSNKTQTDDEGRSLYQKGEQYLNLNGDSHYYSDAISCYREAAKMGNVDAMYRIGFMYRHGWGVGLNNTEAFKWYRKAADKGNADAMYDIGYMYFYGFGVSENYSEAMKWYRKAAEKGNTWAMNAIGEMFQYGKGVTQNYDEALKWYRNSANLGNAQAMMNIGHMYERGEGVSPSKSEMVKWFKDAAQKGHEGAQAKLMEIGE